MNTPSALYRSMQFELIKSDLKLCALRCASMKLKKWKRKKNTRKKQQAMASATTASKVHNMAHLCMFFFSNASNPPSRRKSGLVKSEIWFSHANHALEMYIHTLIWLCARKQWYFLPISPINLQHSTINRIIFWILSTRRSHKLHRHQLWGQGKKNTNQTQSLETIVRCSVHDKWGKTIWNRTNNKNIIWNVYFHVCERHQTINGNDH